MKWQLQGCASKSRLKKRVSRGKSNRQFFLQNFNDQYAHQPNNHLQQRSISTAIALWIFAMQGRRLTTQLYCKKTIVSVAAHSFIASALNDASANQRYSDLSLQIRMPIKIQLHWAQWDAFLRTHDYDYMHTVRANVVQRSNMTPYFHIYILVLVRNASAGCWYKGLKLQTNTVCWMITQIWKKKKHHK